MVYNKFSEYLKNRYGTKVYKLPVSLGTSCPNRDGTIRMDAVNGDHIDVDHANGGRTDGNSAADAKPAAAVFSVGSWGRL